MEDRDISHDLNGEHPGTTPAKFGGFRGQDFNVKVYDVQRMPSDRKSSHGLFPP